MLCQPSPATGTAALYASVAAICTVSASMSPTAKPHPAAGVGVANVIVVVEDAWLVAVPMFA